VVLLGIKLLEQNIPSATYLLSNYLTGNRRRISDLESLHSVAASASSTQRPRLGWLDCQRSNDDLPPALSEAHLGLSVATVPPNDGVTKDPRGKDASEL